ncbi:MAG: hypothetical protein AAF283_11530 [Cyanobacteria bacterium P01_A01_bin.70]
MFVPVEVWDGCAVIISRTAPNGNFPAEAVGLSLDEFPQTAAITLEKALNRSARRRVLETLTLDPSLKEYSELCIP